MTVAKQAGNVLPFSSAMRGMWFRERLLTKEPAPSFTIQIPLMVPPLSHVQAILVALVELFNRHDSLRSSVRLDPRNVPAHHIAPGLDGAHELHARSQVRVLSTFEGTHLVDPLKGSAVAHIVLRDGHPAQIRIAVHHLFADMRTAGRVRDDWEVILRRGAGEYGTEVPSIGHAAERLAHEDTAIAHMQARRALNHAERILLSTHTTSFPFRLHAPTGDSTYEYVSLSSTRLLHAFGRLQAAGRQPAAAALAVAELVLRSYKGFSSAWYLVGDRGPFPKEPALTLENRVSYNLIQLEDFTSALEPAVTQASAALFRSMLGLNVDYCSIVDLEAKARVARRSSVNVELHFNFAISPEELDVIDGDDEDEATEWDTWKVETDYPGLAGVDFFRRGRSVSLTVWAGRGMILEEDLRSIVTEIEQLLIAYGEGRSLSVPDLMRRLRSVHRWPRRPELREVAPHRWIDEQVIGEILRSCAGDEAVGHFEESDGSLLLRLDRAASVQPEDVERALWSNLWVRGVVVPDRIHVGTDRIKRAASKLPTPGVALDVLLDCIDAVGAVSKPRADTDYWSQGGRSFYLPSIELALREQGYGCFPYRAIMSPAPLANVAARLVLS